MRLWPARLLPLVLLAAAAPALAGANAVFSPDGVDVWAVGDGGQWTRSLDGGATFFSGTLGDKGLHGVASTGLTVLVVGDSGKVWRSTDGGGNWNLLVPDGTSPLRAVAMASAQVAFAVGDGGRILKSVDGGASWTPQTSGTSALLRAVRCVDEDEAWVAGHGGTVLHTTDGGADWSPVGAGTSNDLYDIDVDGSRVWVVGALGTARRSTNGGAGWSAVNLRLDARSDVNAVHLASPGTVVLSGGGGFVRTSADDGATWEFPKHRLFGSCGGMHFAGGSGGFVASGDTMLVMRTADGGGSWSLPSGTTVTHQWNFKFNAGGTADKRGNTFAFNTQNPRTLYCMIVDRVYVSRDLGQTWTQIGNPVSNSTKVNAFLVSPKDSTLWVAAVGNSSTDRIVRSTNSGQSWSTRHTQAFGEYGIPVEMDPDRPDTLYFGPDGDVLYRSTDFGQNWSAWSSTSFRSPCDIVVVPESDSAAIYVGDGITSVGNGEVWRSTGGSTTFQIRHVAAASEIPTISVSRLDPARAFATTWSTPNAQVTHDFGLTWSDVPDLVGVTSTWGTDIARDDPNVVAVNRYGGSTGYLSWDGGDSWVEFPKSGSNYALMMRDRGLIFSLNSTGIFKLHTKYTFTQGGTQSLALASPNGGETWAAGSVQSIQWSATDVAAAVIEYRRSPSDPWIEIAAVPGYTGSHAWTVPDDPTHDAQVRVRDAWDGAPSDASSSGFTIAAPRIAASPDPLDFGPVQIGTESVQVLTIDNAGTGALDVTLAAVETPWFTPARSAFSVPAGDSDTLAVTFHPAATQAYEDTLEFTSNVGGPPLRVPLAGAGTDALMLALTAPDGGEIWQYGTVQRIEWQSALVDSVKLEMRVNDGAPWTALVERFPADSGGYWWVVPDAETQQARVRITQAEGSAADSSASYFTIQVPRLLASPLEASFGQVTLGQNVSIRFSLANAGKAALELTSIASDDADFTPDASNLTIAAESIDSLFVTFAPLVEGPDTAVVTIETNGANSPLEILLTGEGTSNVSVAAAGPAAFALGQNEPNPFTGRTTIRYSVPVRAPVVLDVYDLQGHRVATLVDGVMEPGHYTVPFGPGVGSANGRMRDVRAGVYFYRLRAGAFTATRKMLLLR